MKTVKEIYSKYKIYNGLQEHMLRVAAVASIICENTKTDVLSENIISASAIHDMGNIIKADLNIFPELLEPEGVDYWQEVKKDFLKKYGQDEHEANIRIAKELGVSDKTIELIDVVGFSRVRDIEKNNDINQKICNYSDLRVGPRGILTLDQRLEDSRERYKDRPAFRMDNYENNKKICHKIEDEIFSSMDNMKPNDINDFSIKDKMAEILDWQPV